MSEHDRLTQIEDRLDHIGRATSRIETAIVGDPAVGHLGVIQRLTMVEQSLLSIQAERAAERAQRKGAIWVITTIAAAGGALGSAASFVLSSLWQR